MTSMSPSVKVGFFGGTGPEGRGLAFRFAGQGISVALGSRSLERAREAAAELNDRLHPRGGAQIVTAVTNDDIVAQSEFIFLTVPFGSASALLRHYGAGLQAAQVVVDVTVPLVFSDGRVHLMELAAPSASRGLAALVPAHTGFVAAFKTIPAHVLLEPDTSLDCDVFICGDAAAARRRVSDLLRSWPDVRVVDVGSLDMAAALEHMCLLAVNVNRRFRTKDTRFRLIGLQP